VATAEDNPWVNSLVVSLAVEPLLIENPTMSYATAYTSKLRLLTVSRQIGKIKSRLQRTNPVEDPTTYNKTFSELVVLEAQRKQLQNRSLGVA
jgi:DNA primase